MSRYLLDTNVLLHVVNKSKGHEKISARLAAENPDRVRICAITVWEISRMVEKAKGSTRATRAAIEMMGLFQVESLDQRAAALGGNLHAWLSNKGKVIGERDSMIAGVAMINDFIMVTDNVGEFSRVPGLVLENWRA